jgi:magnesium-transporting ATPase (P-type)
VCECARVLSYVYVETQLQRVRRFWARGHARSSKCVCARHDRDVVHIRTRTQVDEFPFDFQRRRVSVVLHDPKTNVRWLVTKGAVTEARSVLCVARRVTRTRAQVLAVCSRYELPKKVAKNADGTGA